MKMIRVSGPVGGFLCALIGAVIMIVVQARKRHAEDGRLKSDQHSKTQVMYAILSERSQLLFVHHSDGSLILH